VLWVESLSKGWAFGGKDARGNLSHRKPGRQCDDQDDVGGRSLDSAVRWGVAFTGLVSTVRSMRHGERGHGGGFDDAGFRERSQFLRAEASGLGKEVEHRSILVG